MDNVTHKLNLILYLKQADKQPVAPVVKTAPKQTGQKPLVVTKPRESPRAQAQEPVIGEAVPAKTREAPVTQGM